MHAKSLWACPTLCDPMDCSPLGSSVHGIPQARILEWVAMPSFRGSSWPRNGTFLSRWILYCWATREAHTLSNKPLFSCQSGELVWLRITPGKSRTSIWAPSVGSLCSMAANRTRSSNWLSGVFVTHAHTYTPPHLLDQWRFSGKEYLSEGQQIKPGLLGGPSPEPHCPMALALCSPCSHLPREVFLPSFPGGWLPNCLLDEITQKQDCKLVPSLPLTGWSEVAACGANLRKMLYQVLALLEELSYWVSAVCGGGDGESGS